MKHVPTKHAWGRVEGHVEKAWTRSSVSKPGPYPSGIGPGSHKYTGWRIDVYRCISVGHSSCDLLHASFTYFRSYSNASACIFCLYLAFHLPCALQVPARRTLVCSGWKRYVPPQCFFLLPPFAFQGLFPCLSMHICFHACPLLARGWCCGCQLHHPFVPILHNLVFSVPWLEVENRSIFGFPFQSR